MSSPSRTPVSSRKARCASIRRGRRVSRLDEEYLGRVHAYHAAEGYKKAMYAAGLGRTALR